MEDMLFPMLWESGATNKTISFLHTVSAGGKKVKKPRITGPTNLRRQDRRKKTLQKRENETLHLSCVRHIQMILFYLCLLYETQTPHAENELKSSV